MNEFFDSPFYDWLSLVAIVATIVSFVFLLISWGRKILRKKQAEFESLLKHYTTIKEEVFRSIMESKTQGRRMDASIVLSSLQLQASDAQHRAANRALFTMVSFGIAILLLLLFIPMVHTAAMLGLLKSFIDTGDFPTKFFEGSSRVSFINICGALGAFQAGFYLYKGEMKLANKYKELSDSIHEGIIEAMQSIVPIQTSMKVDELIPS